MFIFLRLGAFGEKKIKMGEFTESKFSDNGTGGVEGNTLKSRILE